MKAKETKSIYANTEPSQIRNDLEGVETTIESLKQQFFAMASKLHESLSVNNAIGGRYSPNLQETVRAEDKELQDNTNVIYCPSDRRHCQVTDNENSVNCGNIRSISDYQLEGLFN